MRLIDGDWIQRRFERWICALGIDEQYRGAMQQALCDVMAAPTIDAVPVVRCKDCIHAVDITNWRYAKRFGDHAKQCMRCRGDSGFGYYDLSVVYPDGFCDEGEKRND